MRFKALIFALSLLLVPGLAWMQAARGDDGSNPPTLPNLGSGSGDGGDGTADGAPPPADIPDDGGDTGTSPGDPGSDPQPGNPPTTTTTETTPISTATPAHPAPCSVNPSADVGVTIKTDAQSFKVGSMVTYTMDVFNNSGHGECPAPETTLGFTVPRHLELLSPNGVSISRGTSSITGGAGSQQITCSFGTLDPGQHVSVSVVLRADSAGTATADARVGTSVSDSNVGENQQSSVTVALEAPAVPANQPVQQKQEIGPSQSKPGTHLRLPGSPASKPAAKATLTLPD